MPIDDRSIDFAGCDDLPRAVDRLDFKSQPAPGYVGRRCCSDFDTASHWRCSTVFDPDRGADRRLAPLEEGGPGRTVAASIHAINRGVASTGTSPLPIAAAVSAVVTSWRIRYILWLGGRSAASPTRELPSGSVP